MKLVRKPWLWWCLVIVLIVLSLIWAAYRFNWSGTGFQGKTMWDWFQLLIIPGALALVALVFNQTNTRTERQIAQQRYEQDKEAAEKRYERDQEIAKQRYEQDQQIALDKQREDLLQAYFDRMSDLLLKENLRTSSADSEVRNVARTRTISVLKQLDAKRVGDVFTFRKEAGLARYPDPIVDLKGANLSHVKWKGASLFEADFGGSHLNNVIHSGADLTEADLKYANLYYVKLHYANLSHANLFHANLKNADLSGANLSGVSLGKADLSEANLGGANLSGAYLFGANLTGANLWKANLKDAKIDKRQLTPEQIAQAIWD